MSERYVSESTDVAPLGKPLHFEFSGRTAKNRFMKAAMSEKLASWDPKDVKARGIPEPNLVNVYRRWGEGEFGLIVTGNIMIDLEHLEDKGNPGVLLGEGFSGPRFEAFKDLAKAAKAHGSLLVAQVSHPGRQVAQHIQNNPVSASDVQLEGEIFGTRFAKPHAATEDEIANIIDKFAYTAEFLEKAGFDGIELHGAHGYLLAQFLSQTTNKRTDKYGGSLENRTRIIIEVAAEIRKRVSSSFILGIKVNSVEFQAGGFSPEEAKILCEILEKNKFDYVQLSGGTYQRMALQHERESTKKRESFFIEFAENIVKPLTKTRTYLTGGFKTVGAMVKALEIVDGIGIARVSAQEPRFPKDALSGKVTGAIKSQLYDLDFGITNVAGGTQIRQIGQDQEPIDMSSKANVDGFMKDMEAWGKKLATDKENKEHGFIDLTQEAVPYGTTTL